MASTTLDQNDPYNASKKNKAFLMLPENKNWIHSNSHKNTKYYIQILHENQNDSKRTGYNHSNLNCIQIVKLNNQ